MRLLPLLLPHWTVSQENSHILVDLQTPFLVFFAPIHPFDSCPGKSLGFCVLWDIIPLKAATDNWKYMQALFSTAISVNSSPSCLLVPLDWSHLFVLHCLEVLITVLPQAILVLCCSRLPCKELRVTAHTQSDRGALGLSESWSSQVSVGYAICPWRCNPPFQLVPLTCGV